MKSHRKSVIKSLLAIFCAGVLLVPDVARGLDTISSLDFALTGSQILDCDIMSAVDLERDPSWTNEEYYIRLAEEYMLYLYPDAYPTVEAYREEVDSTISAWKPWIQEIYLSYAEVMHEDFYDRYDYYAAYHEELKDEYYRVYNYRSLNLDPTDFPIIHSFDVIANYCSDEGDPIATTYNWYDILGRTDAAGYPGFIMMDGEEVYLDAEDLQATSSGYQFHRDGFADLKVKLSRVNATTLRATYTLKNLTGKNTNYGLAFYGDIELGGNDKAAIEKTDKTFVVTQDDVLYEDTFGAQFSINIDPVPTTTYVGYYEDAYDYHWENSAKNYYTALDDVDTGLAYSWQGLILSDETKTFTATYNMAVADAFVNNFYYLSDGYAEPRYVIEALDGGVLNLPMTDFVPNVGHHRAWNTKADSTGRFYEDAMSIIAHEDAPNYYEVEVDNDVVSDVRSSWGNIRSLSLGIDDELREKYRTLADAVYSNIYLGIEIEEYTDYDVDYAISEGYFAMEDILDTAGEEGEFDSMFYLEDFYEMHRNEYGDYIEDDVLEEAFPLTVKLKLNEDFALNNSNFRLVRLDCPEDGPCSSYSLLPTTFDRETGELSFMAPQEFIGDLFALVYDKKPAVPGVPDTGYDTFDKVSSAVASTCVALPVILVAGYLIKRYAVKK